MNPTWFMAWFRVTYHGLICIMFMCWEVSSMENSTSVTQRILGIECKNINNGEVTSTKSRRPLELMFYEGYKSMEDAKRRERYFKTAKGKSSLNMMLRNSLKSSII